MEADVVVLTALPLEYGAVRERLTDVRRRPHARGTQFEVGVHAPSGARVALVETGAGNLGAATLAERAIDTFAPRAVMFVGIAGALHDDLRLGDVVVATKVYGYHGGKQEDDGFRARPTAYDADHELGQRAGFVARTFPGAVHFRPIAAGEVVLTSRDADLARLLRDHYNDAAAVEMESVGMARAAHLGRTPTLTVRGISDRADATKAATDEAGGQPRAAARAAEFALAVIGDLVASGAPAPSSTARRSTIQGVQVGDHNTQHNTFT